MKLLILILILTISSSYGSISNIISDKDFTNISMSFEDTKKLVRFKKKYLEIKKK